MKTVFAAVALIGAGSMASAEFQTVPLGNLANATWTSNGAVINGTTYPTGSQTLGGVPFDISASGTSGNFIWHADNAVGDNPRTLTLPVNIYGVTSVHSLINTLWGEKNTGAFAAIEFTGSEGATFTFDLDGNDDIRDYNFNPIYTTLINGTTTTEVFNNGLGQHLDKVQVDLPAAFATQTLTSIRYVDNGNPFFQRIFVAGVTVNAVPAPGAAGVLALAGLAGVRRRR